jgi:hypothetical protein
MKHEPPVPAANRSPYPVAEPPHPRTDPPPAPDATVDAPRTGGIGRIGAAVALGIGAAVAGLLFARRAAPAPKPKARDKQRKRKRNKAN